MIILIVFSLCGEFVVNAQLAIKQLNWKLTQLNNKSEKKFTDYEEAFTVLGRRLFAMEEVLDDAVKQIKGQSEIIRKMAHAQLLCGTGLRNTFFFI